MLTPPDLGALELAGATWLVRGASQARQEIASSLTPPLIYFFMTFTGHPPHDLMACWDHVPQPAGMLWRAGRARRKIASSQDLPNITQGFVKDSSTFP